MTISDWSVFVVESNTYILTVNESHVAYLSLVESASNVILLLCCGHEQIIISRRRGLSYNYLDGDGGGGIYTEQN